LPAFKPSVSWLSAIAGCVALAALAAVIVAVRHAPRADGSPIIPSGVWLDVFRIALAIAFIAYVVAAGLAWRRFGNRRVVVAVAGLLQVLPLLGPLLLSTDAYTYWAYGRLGSHHGVNPYAVTPSAFPDDPAYRVMGASWHHTTTFYGPAFTAISEGISKVASSGHVAELAFRGVATLSMLAIVLLLAGCGASTFAIVVVGWNPLFALHFAGGGHNDALMMALTVAALQASRDTLWTKAAFWVLAVAVKWVAIVFLALHVASGSRDYRVRLPGRVLVVGVFAIAASFALFGTAWLRSAGGLSSQARRTGSLGASRWLSELGIGHRAIVVLLALTLALALAALAYLAATRRRVHLSLAGTVLAVLQGWLNPWYALWGSALLVEEDSPLCAAVLSISLSGFLLLDAVPH
jgi:hypothetical protein